MQAEINIRKGKKLPVFELAFKAEYGITAADTAKPEMGKLHIFEVYQDDVSEDFEVRPTASFAPVVPLPSAHDAGRNANEWWLLASAWRYTPAPVQHNVSNIAGSFCNDKRKLSCGCPGRLSCVAHWLAQ